MNIIFEPWPWYVAGPLITMVMFLLYYYGRKFGVSSNLETLCTIGGAGTFNSFFKSDWKQKSWSLLFVVGLVLGGFISHQWLTPNKSVAISEQTVQDLKDLGFENPGAHYLPPELFSMEAMFTVKGFFILLIAGVLIGFGARYAGGCTSGHAITGLSNLELPSLLSVIGFFVGGLLMTWLLFPLLF